MMLIVMRGRRGADDECVGDATRFTHYDKRVATSLVARLTNEARKDLGFHDG